MDIISRRTPEPLVSSLNGVFEIRRKVIEEDPQVVRFRDIQAEHYVERLQVELDGEGKCGCRCDHASKVPDGTFVSRADIPPDSV